MAGVKFDCYFMTSKGYKSAKTWPQPGVNSVLDCAIKCSRYFNYGCLFGVDYDEKKEPHCHFSRVQKLEKEEGWLHYECQFDDFHKNLVFISTFYGLLIVTIALVKCVVAVYSRNDTFPGDFQPLNNERSP